jgi:calcineurin-like phosphoesterase family protein
MGTREVTPPVGTDGYDIIGDVHGHVDRLTELLGLMGYHPDGDTWRHPRRAAVFVGDLIDGGPAQIETLGLVKAMVDAGSAQMVLANHEFNAIAWHTPDPEHPGEYLRPHTEKNRRQHQGFLGQVGEDSAAHHDALAWFMTLSLWLDLGDLRVVHACWDPAAMADLAPVVGPADSLTPELVEAACRKGSPEYHAIEHLLKGPEIDVDPAFLDPSDNPRRRARFRWWDPTADTMKRAAIIPDDAVTVDGVPYPELPDTPLEEIPLPPYLDRIPVFYGHYWETGEPTISGSHTACVDYSAGRGGPLVAYRWSGESALAVGNFVSTAMRFSA